MKNSMKYLVYFSIIITFLLDSLESLEFIYGNIFKFLKYGIVIITFTFCFLQIFILNSKKIKNYYFINQVKWIITVAVYFGFISIICIIKTNHFSYKTIEELLQLCIPVLYAFVIINILNFDEIAQFLKILLFISIMGYVVSIGIGKFTLTNLLSISFLDSYSIFESAQFAEISAALAAFFIYYRKKYPLLSWISILFCFMTFKRVFVIQMIILLLITILRLCDYYVKKKYIILSAIITLTFTLLFYFLIRPENEMIFIEIFGESPGLFTMGRCYRLWYPLRAFESFGFGSTSAVLGYNLELDFIKIYLEIGVLGLILFIVNYLKVAQNNLYLLALMLTMFMNLLFASCLTSTFGWIVRMIAIACILKDKPLFQKRKKIKFIWRK